MVAAQLCPVVVGRDAELAALRQALDDAAEGRGRCLLLVGEAGIGKSRLARELAGWAATKGLPVATGRSSPAARSAPYRPWTEALLQLLRRRSVPDDAEMGRWLPVLSPVLPGLFGGAGRDVEVPASVRGEALVHLLRRLAPAGVVLLLEDLHWADPDTLDVLEYLAGGIAGEPVLLALTLRNSPSEALTLAGRLRGRAGLVRLDLERLEGDDLKAMIQACRPDATSQVVERITEASEGLPLLVEDLLASPGLPADFAATVAARLDALDPGARQVIEAAAVLGRHFDFGLLSPITGRSEAEVTAALAEGVDAQLLASQGPEMRFRHALTREAVLESVLPPHQRRLAEAALDTLAGAGPAARSHGVGPERRELAIDLALRAGRSDQAGRLLAESGRQSLAWGALATAAETLGRAVRLLGDDPQRTAAELDLVEALALAGRVDEATGVGGRLVSRLGADPSTAAARCEVHLRLAQAAVAASRWPVARHHLDQARRLSGVGGPDHPGWARQCVLEAEVAIAEDHYDRAAALAEQVLATAQAADVRCHAYEILGRTRRSVDLAGGREAFLQALVTAEEADLAHWRLRALHELGTIDLFDHAGVDRLLQARRAAEQMGALSTAAVLDLQLSAAFTCRWDLARADAHASSAVTLAEDLGLDRIRAQGLILLAGTAGMRADLAATVRYADMAAAAVGGDEMLQGFGWGMRATALLLAGDGDAALEPYSRGMAVLGRLPHAEPAALRALWPLVLAARGDRRAQAAVDEARRLGVASFKLNGSMVGFAEAVLAGQRGDRRRASELVAEADPGWANCEGWADLSRLLAAPAARADGWGEPDRWLAEATHRFEARGLEALRRRCEELLARADPNPWAPAGVTAREADVLRLVAEGLANKEVADRLHLSPRTVEKHVESLLRKVGARSRTELVARLGEGRPPAT